MDITWNHPGPPGSTTLGRLVPGNHFTTEPMARRDCTQHRSVWTVLKGSDLQVPVGMVPTATLKSGNFTFKPKSLVVYEVEIVGATAKILHRQRY